jgi:RNA polymerase sigma factor (sigma-70 family)
MEESDLVMRLKNRDQSALSYLYDNYSDALYGLIVRLLKKEEIAEEVLQDVFLKIWDRAETYDPAKGKLFTWMINIARNHTIDKIRSKEIGQKKKTDTIDFLVDGLEFHEPTHTGVDTIGLKEMIMKLPKDQYFIVNQLYMEGYTQVELAREFNIPIGTVKTRLRSAMTGLRIILDIK